MSQENDFCPNCGVSQKPNSKFCHKCGTSQISVEVTADELPEENEKSGVLDNARIGNLTDLEARKDKSPAVLIAVAVLLIIAIAVVAMSQGLGTDTSSDAYIGGYGYGVVVAEFPGTTDCATGWDVSVQAGNIGTGSQSDWMSGCQEGINDYNSNNGQG